MEGYQQVVGEVRMGENVQGIRSINARSKIEEEVKNSMGNGEAKELTCMTHGHELGGGMIVGGWYRADGNGGETKMDNCNSIINKIY